MNTPDVVLIVAWIAVVAYLVWQTLQKPASAARTGTPGRRLRARPGNGGMSERFTQPPRYGLDGDQSPEPARAEGASVAIPADHLAPPDQLAFALARLTPSLLCTLCLIELKQARAEGRPDPEVLPGIVMAATVADGQLTVGVLCEVRHPLAVGAPLPAGAPQLGD